MQRLVNSSNVLPWPNDRTAAELMELFQWVSEVEIWSVLQDLTEARYKKHAGLGKGENWPRVIWRSHVS